MRVGVVFPQTEIGADPVAIRDFAQAVEEMGYDHLLAYDHVLGADVTHRPGWLGYTSEDMFHEVLVLFGYLAAVTRRLELVTGILILPQRQTALVAKQAAAVDVLSGGRLRLGVGLGWNSVEYEALGMDFRRRGAAIEEQIHVLRLLWTQPVVTFHGRRHRITAAGINPLPVQRPIPIWMGGESDAAIRRTARLADGWFPGGTLRTERERLPQQDRAEQVERLRRYAREAGRDPTAIGLEGRIAIAGSTPDRWRQEVKRWRGLGATHVSVVTMRAGLPTPQAHLDAVRRFLEAAKG